MRSCVRVALAASQGRHAVRLLNLETGASVPVASPMDDGGGAFDVGLGRRGWVAVNVEYEVGAYRDGGGLAGPVLLPEAWELLPAASDELVLLRLYPGRSGFPGERTRVAVVDQHGGVVRSAVLPWGTEAFVVGEVDAGGVAGVVTWAGIAGWDGVVYPLPGEHVGDPYVDPRPVGVVGGRRVVLEGVDYVESVDLGEGSRCRLEVSARPRRDPHDSRLPYGQLYNAAGTWLAARDRFSLRPGGGLRQDEDCLIAGPEGQLRWLPNLPRAASMWLGERLVRWNYEDGRVVEYDPVSDRFSPSDLAPLDWDREIVPRVEVTGRIEWPR